MRLVLFIVLMSLTSTCTSRTSKTQVQADVFEDSTKFRKSKNQIKIKKSSFKYAELEKKKEMQLISIELDHSQDLQGKVVVHKISGPIAFQILKSQGMERPFDKASNDYLEKLLSFPESIAFVYEYPPEPGLPISTIFIPEPEASPTGSSPSGTGMVIHTGLGPTKASQAKNMVDYESDFLDTITKKKFQHLLKGKKGFVVFIHAQGCGSSDQAASSAALFNLPKNQVFFDKEGKVTGEYVIKIIKTLLYPIFIYFESGEPKDFYLAVNNSPIKMSLSDFFVRNQIIEGERSQVRPKRAKKIDLETWKRRVSFLKHWPSANFESQDLSGIRLSRGSLTGANMRNTNLEGADFRNAILTRVDFTGANLSKVNFEGAYFRNTICPDGTQSEDHKNKCPVEGPK